MMLDGNLDTGDLMTNDQGTWSNQITVSSICFWHIHFMMISFMKKNSIWHFCIKKVQKKNSILIYKTVSWFLIVVLGRNTEITQG